MSVSNTELNINFEVVFKGLSTVIVAFDIVVEWLIVVHEYFRFMSLFCQSIISGSKDS